MWDVTISCDIKSKYDIFWAHTHIPILEIDNLLGKQSIVTYYVMKLNMINVTEEKER